MYRTIRASVEGHAVTVHVPIRSASERVAHDAELDAAIRRACPGWRLRKAASALPPDAVKKGIPRQRETCQETPKPTGAL